MHLKAGATATEQRQEESDAGAINCMFVGGAITVRVLNGKLKSVPKKLENKDVEMMKFMAVGGLAGEHEDSYWFAREDQLLPRPSDENHAAISQLKRSWVRVNKEALAQPLYAPLFPSTPNSTPNWDALLARALELHNAGKLEGCARPSRARAPPFRAATRTAHARSRTPPCSALAHAAVLFPLSKSTRGRPLWQVHLCRRAREMAAAATRVPLPLRDPPHEPAVPQAGQGGQVPALGH
jgi:hypothetical protein